MGDKGEEERTKESATREREGEDGRECEVNRSETEMEVERHTGERGSAM